jgi:hypothetical protein
MVRYPHSSQLGRKLNQIIAINYGKRGEKTVNIPYFHQSDKWRKAKNKS